ncbi:peptidoglycan/LPS O-acetylase OafA/YrhL [Sphingomonas naasensis]|uniref:Acyltransferase n=1 Tax=Sphingomonas naasensis TaxID=1344951 RepID=A0A4S1WKT1_9SPHN|nr:acyltransferase [Sphingomonas naasensis]NIJ20959.1 peptidoglycan/LPS O-acetylase OafA/YrhL [Sphingomonas naasensis]TGX43343.1 acyltransferase [Sphingomonas naasensis]
MKSELRALTSVRGIAAWLVVLYHVRLSIAGLPPAAEAVLAKGYLAVDFFFLLSGFVIWMSWSARVRGGGMAAIPEFLRRRVARIWPLHLFMLGVALALALALRATGRETPQFPLAELPLHVALLQNWGFTRTLAWNDPAWSISCELAAYLLFPLLVLTIDWRRVPTAAVLGAIAALLVLLHFIFDRFGAATLGAQIPRLGLIRCILEFACGTAIGALWLRWRARWRVPALAAAGIAALAFAGWTAGAPETLAVPVAFAALLLALALSAGRARNPLEAAPLHYLGEISYATYLGHFLLWVAFKLAFVDASHRIGWPFVALYCALVLAGSAALYHLVERPAQRWLNGLAFRRSPTRSRGTGSAPG